MESTKLGKNFSKSVTTSIRKAVIQNKTLILREIQRKKGLYDLLIKWNSGVSLSDAEKEIVKIQLLDIAKAIPALAIFMLPFGALVLVFLIKFLPSQILPAAFYANSEHQHSLVSPRAGDSLRLQSEVV